jgi:hypothetical protein
MEVCEEEEIKDLSYHRSDYRQLRDTHHTKVQGLAARDERRIDETKRRHQQAIERISRDRDVKETQIAATSAHAARLAANQKEAEEAALHAVLFDPMVKQVEQQFVPDLLSSVCYCSSLLITLSYSSSLYHPFVHLSIGL